jgi:hypothetical protein
MTKLRATHAIGPGFCIAVPVVKTAGAQISLPAAKPPEVMPGDFMAYRQSKPETRAAIIACLKELN